jgi:hypothetical protein
LQEIAAFIFRVKGIGSSEEEEMKFLEELVPRYQTTKEFQKARQQTP